MKRAIILLVAGTLISGVAAFAVSAKPEPVATRTP
jgi:hypothetical protein